MLKVAQLVKRHARTQTQDTGLRNLFHKQHTVWEELSRFIKTDLHSTFVEDPNSCGFVENRRMVRCQVLMHGVLSKPINAFLKHFGTFWKVPEGRCEKMTS